MVTLVEDIIRLSQLDEGDAMPTETVDLLALSQEAVTNLQDAAAKQQVSLSVDGGHAAVIGVRRLLYEVIFNLCDNAIKYNVPDGSRKGAGVLGERDLLRHGVGYRHRHRPGAPEPGVRAVLPGG